MKSIVPHFRFLDSAKSRHAVMTKKKTYGLLFFRTYFLNTDCQSFDLLEKGLFFHL